MFYAVAGGDYAGELSATVKTHGSIKRVGKSYVKTFDAQGNEVFKSGTTESLFWLGNASSTFEATGGWHSFYRTFSCHAADAKPGTYTVRIYAGDTAGNPVYVRGTTDVPLIVQEYEVTFATPDKASFLPDELGLLDSEKAANADHSHTYANQQFDYLDSRHHRRPHPQRRPRQRRPVLHHHRRRQRRAERSHRRPHIQPPGHPRGQHPQRARRHPGRPQDRSKVSPVLMGRTPFRPIARGLCAVSSPQCARLYKAPRSLRKIRLFNAFAPQKTKKWAKSGRFLSFFTIKFGRTRKNT